MKWRYGVRMVRFTTVLRGFQYLNNRSVPSSFREGERRLTVEILEMHVCPPLEQEPDKANIPVLCREHEGSVATLIHHVDVIYVPAVQ